MPVVVAQRSDDFVESIGVNTHWTYPKYVADKAALMALLVDSGIRNIRDVAVGQNPDLVATLTSLYGSGIRSTLLIFPAAGIVPTLAYWSGYGPGETQTINDFLASLPAGIVKAIEMPNELDIFYTAYKWHVVLNDDLSNDPESDLYYGLYGVAFTISAWNALRANAAFNAIKLIGPSVGAQVPSPFADASMHDYVDRGSMHPYPARVNAFQVPVIYGGVSVYYANGSQPSSNIAADAFSPDAIMFDWYQPAFTSGGGDKKLMAATETGYSNGGGSTPDWFSQLLGGKQTPRLFAEYFKNLITDTFYYELVDEGTDPTNGEQNDGLLNYDLTPKPAFTALKSMISVLKEPGASFSPGSLNYTLSAAASGAYTRTAYAHDLLLQKSNGDFFLLLWHEISNSSNTDAAGAPISGVQRDIAQPSLLTTITLPATIGSAIVYTYQSDWTLAAVDLDIVANVITVKAQDKLSIIRLRSAVVAEADLELETGFDLLLENGDNLLLENSGPPSTGNSRGLLTLGVG